MAGQPPQAATGDVPRPQTLRGIARAALERLPKLCGEDDTALFGAAREGLVESIAEELAGKSSSHLKEDAARPGIDDILDETTIRRFSNAPAEVNQVAREVVGQARRPAMEEAARRILRQEDALSPEETDAAITAIDRGQRRSIPESSNRTFQDCVDELLARCRAHLSRARGDRTQWQHSVPQSEALEIGTAMRGALAQALIPAVRGARAIDVVGPALIRLSALEHRVRRPAALRKQLAAEDLLKGGQDEQLQAEIALRAHFPFGLVRERSHAVLCAALYLLQAQANHSAVQAAVQRTPHPRGPRSLYRRVGEELGAVMARKSQRDGANGWEERYLATPGALDCLRSAAPVLTQDEVPAFVGVPVSQLPRTAPDPAARVLSDALPLDESTRGEGTVPWVQARWNPLGRRLLDKVNREHYSLRTKRYFNEEAFQHVVTRLIHHALEDLLKRLQRTEGLAVGLPNAKEPYDDRSVLSLNQYLMKAWSQASGEAFGRYRNELDQAGSPPRKPKSARPETDAPSPSGLPDGIVLLSVDSVRERLETLLTASEPYQWASDVLADRHEIDGEETRAAAHGAIQVIDWAAWNEPALRGRDIGEILEAYSADEDLVVQPLTRSQTALLRDLLFDTVLADETTRRILAEHARNMDPATTTVDINDDTTEDTIEDTTP